MITAGTRVISANGNLGTVVGNMTKDGSMVAIKLDNGRQISCLATLCKPTVDILGTLQDIRQAIADLYTQNYVTAETYQIITNTVNREIDNQLRQPVLT